MSQSERVKRPKMTNSQVRWLFNPADFPDFGSGGELKKPTLGDFWRKSAMKNCFPETRKVRIIFAPTFMLFALQIICNCMGSEDESTLHQRSRSLSFLPRCSNFPQDRQTLSGHCFGVILTFFWSRCADYTLSLSVVPPGIHSTIIHYMLHHCTKYLEVLWCGPHSECVVKITVESLSVCVAGYFENISRVEWFSLGPTNPAAVDQTKGGLDRGTHGGVDGRNTSNMLFWINKPDLLSWVRWLSSEKKLQGVTFTRKLMIFLSSDRSRLSKVISGHFPWLVASVGQSCEETIGGWENLTKKGPRDHIAMYHM